MTRDTEKCSFSILTRLTYEHWNIWTFCRYKRTIRFIPVFVLSEMAGVHCISSTTSFARGPSVDGGVHSIWTVPIIWFKNSTVFTSYVSRVESKGWNRIHRPRYEVLTIKRYRHSLQHKIVFRFWGLTTDFLAVSVAHKHSTDALWMIPRTLTDLSSLIKLLCIGLLTFLRADYKRLGMTWQLKKKK